MTSVNAVTIQVSRLSRGTKTLGSRDGKQTVVIDGLSTLRQVAEDIRSDEDLKAQTNKLRVMHNRGGREGPYKGAKLAMPAIVPAMQAAKGTLLKGLPVGDYHNGLYGYDIDEHREALDLAAVREALIAAPGAVLVGASCAGDALYAVFAGPFATDEKDYQRHWEAIGAEMPHAAWGASGKASKNSNRLRFLAHDPNVWLASDPVAPLAGAVELLPASASSPSPPTPQDDDHALDLDALAHISPPDGGGDEEYNRWLSWLRTLKSLGFSTAEVEAWSARGANCQPDEVISRWGGLRADDDPTEARNKLRGHAHNRGWEQRREHPQPTAPPQRAPATPQDPDEAAPVPAPWFGFIEWWTHQHSGGRFRFSDDPDARGWWGYGDKVWRPIASNDLRIHDELAHNRWRYADELRTRGNSGLAAHLLEHFVSATSKGDKGDIWVALRVANLGPIPQPALHHIATPDAIVDLRTLITYPHSPAYNIRGVTRGRFLPDGVEEHWRALKRRFSKVFTPPMLHEYIRAVALALTGKAQDHRALVMLLGESGSGKGDAASVARIALGHLGMGVGLDWLREGFRSDIDTVTATILERQPRILVVDEVGGDTKVAVSDLLSKTGKGELHGRKPHGPLLFGTPIFQMWTTAVSPPHIPRGQGGARRLCLLPTLRSLGDSERDPDGGRAQELLDAVVTLAILEAPAVYQPGYCAPEGDSQGKQQAIDTMDPVGAWIEAQDDLDGKTSGDALAHVRSDLSLSDRELSATAFGKLLNSSAKWTTYHGKKGTVIQCRPPRLLDDDRRCPNCGKPLALTPAEISAYSPESLARVVCDECASR